MSDRSTQRFNHVAMSVSRNLLEAPECSEITCFYGEVFGWTEMPGMTRPGELLVLRAHSNEQFVFLAASDEPMRCAKLDHFGLSVEAPAELDAIYERARKFQERDERVEIVEKQVEDFKVLKLHSFYVRYRLPLMVEVQCYDWAEGVGPDSLPSPSS
jgi:hypothetical protein